MMRAAFWRKNNPKTKCNEETPPNCNVVINQKTLVIAQFKTVDHEKLQNIVILYVTTSL